MAGVVKEITDQTFQKEVLQADKPTLVDFWAAWCGPCKMLSPIVEEVAGKYQDKFKFCKVNVDENPQQAANFQIMSIPTMIFFKDGQPVDKVIGLVSKEEIVKRLQGTLANG